MLSLLTSQGQRLPGCNSKSFIPSIELNRERKENFLLSFYPRLDTSFITSECCGFSTALADFSLARMMPPLLLTLRTTCQLSRLLYSVPLQTAVAGLGLKSQRQLSRSKPHRITWNLLLNRPTSECSLIVWIKLLWILWTCSYISPHICGNIQTLDPHSIFWKATDVYCLSEKSGREYRLRWIVQFLSFI